MFQPQVLVHVRVAVKVLAAELALVQCGLCMARHVFLEFNSTRHYSCPCNPLLFNDSTHPEMRLSAQNLITDLARQLARVRPVHSKDVCPEGVHIRMHIAALRTLQR